MWTNPDIDCKATSQKQIYEFQAVYMYVSKNFQKVGRHW